MTAIPLLVEHFEDRKRMGELDDVVVVSPDAGRAKLANHVAEKLGANLAVLTKQRPEHNAAAVTLLVGDVEGRDAILIDDMIDTAGTLVAGADTIRAAGARRVYAAAVHGLFSPPAFDRLATSSIEEIVVTDTVPLHPDAPPGLIKVVSVARILADSVHNVFCDESVSEIFAGENQLF